MEMTPGQIMEAEISATLLDTTPSSPGGYQAQDDVLLSPPGGYNTTASTFTTAESTFTEPGSNYAATHPLSPHASEYKVITTQFTGRDRNRK